MGPTTRAMMNAVDAPKRTADPIRVLAAALEVLRTIDPFGQGLSADTIVALNNAEQALERVIRSLQGK